MRKKLKWLYILPAIVTLLVACEEESPVYEQLTGSTEGTQIYIAKAAKGIQDLTIYPYADERSTTFGVNYGGLSLSNADILVHLSIDQEALDSINNIRVNGGQDPYVLFPEDTYTLDKTALTIPKGEQSSDIALLTYFPNAFDGDKSYVLPISISDASGFPINNTSKTVFFEAGKLEPKAANTTGWVATATSVQGDGREYTGLPSAAIDGDLSTIWHSQWYPVTEAFPHTLSFDMLEEIYVLKIAMAPRQNNANGSTKFYLEGTLNGTDWFALTEELDFDPANTAYQEYEIEEQFLKQIRVTFTEGKNANGATHLAEFVVYTY